MRKRTQLVGFEFGHWKHVQYAAEFMDNALDAIESFQWTQLKNNSKTAFTMDKDLALEGLTLVREVEEESEFTEVLNGEARETLMHEVMGVDTIETIEDTEAEPEPELELVEEIIEEEILSAKEKRDKEKREKVVKTLLEDMEKLLQPVERIVDYEPIIILKLTESEAPLVLSQEVGKKNVMKYTFEVFDNGTGMNRQDLRKFGIYLASSKSVKLKQTRGSQGFGSPSAFSDAQNTTGEPVIGVSKTQFDVYATATEFFTTSKNEKNYVIAPTDIETAFLHGTYVKLSYLNIKYVKGYFDEYIKKTALMNPHVTILYQISLLQKDGTRDKTKNIITRRVNRIPDEPVYALPHPSSANIGDFQDYLTKSEHNTIPAFLKDNFVRMSSSIAKEIVDKAERQLQDKLNLLVVDNFFLNKPKKPTDPIFLMRYEKKVWGKSTKEREQLITYMIESEGLKAEYWDIIDQFNKRIQDKEKIKKKINTNKKNFIKTDISRKEEKEIEKIITQLKNEIITIEKDKDDLKQKLEKIFKNLKDGILEIKTPEVRKQNTELLEKVLISKTKPVEVTNNREQFDALFLAFKSIKYMAPPTDTAIPVGPSVLESVLIKDYGLKFSANLEDFGTTQAQITPIENFVREERVKDYLEENPELTQEELNNITVDYEDVLNTNYELLEKFSMVGDEETFQDNFQQFLAVISVDESIDQVDYESAVSDYIIKYSRDDDFVSAETRNPTSGKGLAFVVESALAYGGSLDTPKKSSDVLHRYVNRTPKLRDNAACAITQAVQSVNWKNYKVDTYDNGLPKGPLRLIVNVSGPFVHLMFSSQSKNALAMDENLLSEIKRSLESIGRRLKTYINRRVQLSQSKKRSSLIEKYIPIFAESVYQLAKNQDKYKNKIKRPDLINRLKKAIGKKPVVEPTEITEEVEVKKVEEKPPIKEEVITEVAAIEAPPTDAPITVKAAPKTTKVEPIPTKLTPKIIKPSPKATKPVPKTQKPAPQIRKPGGKITKTAVNTIKSAPTTTKPTPTTKKPAPAAIKPSQITARPALKKPTKTVQSSLSLFTSENILSTLTNEYQSIKHLIFKLKIRDMMDARLLQKKLKTLENEGKVLVDIQGGKKFWKLKK